MADTSGGRLTRLEWVSCPSCSTTFRVAIPKQFDQITVVEIEEEVEDTPQRVTCVNKECGTPFFLDLV